MCVCVLGEAGKRLLAGYFYLVIRKNRFSPDSRQLAMQRSPMLDFESFMLVRANGREEGELSDLGAEFRPLWLSQHSGGLGSLSWLSSPWENNRVNFQTIAFTKTTTIHQRHTTRHQRSHQHIKRESACESTTWATKCCMEVRYNCQHHPTVAHKYLFKEYLLNSFSFQRRYEVMAKTCLDINKIWVQISAVY